jgi:hypothetical protein
MWDFFIASLIVGHVSVQLIAREPFITISALLAGFMFVKWFFATGSDSDDNLHIKHTPPSKEEILKRQNREREKLLDEQIAHAKRKIDVMKKNDAFGSIIDNFAGNSITDEQAKIIELKKQKELLKPVGVKFP